MDQNQYPELILPLNHKHQIELVLNQLLQHQKIIQNIFIQLIHLLITDKTDHRLSRPLLTLIIISSKDFQFVSEIIIQGQPPDKSQSLGQIFNQLLQGIQMNLEFSNKNKFSGQLSQFSKDLRSIIDLSLFYKTMVNYF